MFGYLKSENVRQRTTFDVLGIGQRVLVTPHHTIALASVSTVTVGIDPAPRPRLALAIAAVVLCVAALAAASSPEGFGQGPLAWAILFGAGGLGALFAALRPGDRRSYLIVTTSDGRVARFLSDDDAVLEQVRQIITSKLDGDQIDLTCTVNFSTGDVAPWTGASRAALAGTGAQYAEPGANRPAPTRPTGAAQAARNGAGSAVAAPGPQPSPAVSGGGMIANNTNGAGFAAQRDAHGSGPRPIDFYEWLPSVVEMQRFYAGDPNAAHVERRLSELELLMRSGAQTLAQRTRIAELTGDLAHYLQGYPPAVRVFQDIAAEVGGETRR